MKYSKELSKIFDDLKKETNPGKTISVIDVILRILSKYRSDEEVDDINMTSLVANYLSNTGLYTDFMDDLILLQDDMPREESEDGSFMDSTLLKCLKLAEDEVNTRAQTPSKSITAFYFILGTLKGCQEVKKIFEEYGIGYDVLDSVFESNKGIFDCINNIVSSLMERDKPKEDNTVNDSCSMGFDPDEFMESIGFPLSSDDNSAIDKSTENSKTPMLDKYARNLLLEDLDPVYGRENELLQLLEILGCKKKNNAILIGEAGVGKTSVVELLAQKIKEKSVPKNFLDKKIYSLDLNALVAGTKYRGQYEERLQGVIKEVTSNPDIIVFIDEIHNLIGNGGSDGNGDAANILKPYLAKGKFQCIGSTTFKEYRKYIESDAALKRRFQTIIINEPSLDETKVILKNIKNVYEKHHNVIYPKEVINACVDLSERYLSSSKFPDKAIDALDLSGSLCRLSESKSDTSEYLKLEEELKKTQNLKNEAVGKQDFKEAIIQRDNEENILKSINTKSKPVKVTLDSVYQAIGKRSGIPIDTIGSSDREKLVKLNKILNQEVIGQAEAVREIVLNLQKNSLSIRDQNKPISMLFTGPTGCGKTYLCKRLAEEFFGSKNALIRFDMGEFEEKHSISKLTGATASYVGYDDEPMFEKIRHQPYSVVLFDEIEKAAPEIFQVFLNILDEGYVTLGNGVKADFRHCIIIFTGNIGTRELSLFGNGVGYGSTGKNEVIDKEKKDSIIKKAIEKTFAPEFINRLSNIVIFDSLGKPELHKIIDLELSKLSARLKDSKISIKVAKAVKDYIISLCNLKFGARDLQRKISEVIEEKLCEKLLSPDVPEGKKTFSFDYKENSIVIDMK